MSVIPFGKPTNALSEFDCKECGRHICRFGYVRAEEMERCAECINMPRWFDNEELRSILDPTFDVQTRPLRDDEKAALSVVPDRADLQGGLAWNFRNGYMVPKIVDGEWGVSLTPKGREFLAKVKQ
jgi:hypothetical protein